MNLIRDIICHIVSYAFTIAAVSTLMFPVSLLHSFTILFTMCLEYTCQKCQVLKIHSCQDDTQGSNKKLAARDCPHFYSAGSGRPAMICGFCQPVDPESTDSSVQGNRHTPSQQGPRDGITVSPSSNTKPLSEDRLDNAALRSPIPASSLNSPAQPPSSPRPGKRELPVAREPNHDMIRYAKRRQYERGRTSRPAYGVPGEDFDSEYANEVLGSQPITDEHLQR